jgi:hypothetical protein
MASGLIDDSARVLIESGVSPSKKTVGTGCVSFIAEITVSYFDAIVSLKRLTSGSVSIL